MRATFPFAHERCRTHFYELLEEISRYSAFLEVMEPSGPFGMEAKEHSVHVSQKCGNGGGDCNGSISKHRCMYRRDIENG